MDTNETYIKLADYMYDDLDEDQIRELEKECAENTDVEDLRRLNRQVTDFLKAKIQLEEMKADPMLSEAERLAGLVTDDEARTLPMKNLGIQGRRKSSRYLKFIPLAAAAIAFILVIRVFIPGPDPERVFRSFYAPLQATNHMQRDAGPAVDETASRAIQLYNRRDYRQSLQLLENSGEGNLPAAEKNLFRGLNYMGLEQFERAAVILENVTREYESFRPEALWYLSLCYLRTGEYGKTVEALDQLKLYDGNYADDVRSLLKKVSRLR